MNLRELFYEFSLEWWNLYFIKWKSYLLLHLRNHPFGWKKSQFIHFFAFFHTIEWRIQLSKRISSSQKSEVIKVFQVRKNKNKKFILRTIPSFKTWELKLLIFLNILYGYFEKLDIL